MFACWQWFSDLAISKAATGVANRTVVKRATIEVNTRAEAGGYYLIPSVFADLKRFSGFAILGAVVRVVIEVADVGAAI